jgi:hypothetical protein
MEAGAPEFDFDEPQFKSESLRHYRVLIKDARNRTDVWVEASPFRYISLKMGLRREDITPQYDYTFDGDAAFRLMEYRIGLRYAFGERVMQSLHRTISFGTKYPIFWLQMAKGLRLAQGEYSYTKFDFKVQASREFLGFGTSSMQVRLGKVWGNAPYAQLYNGLGSYRGWAAIAHNSFETMGYNEFMSDWHCSVFYTHDFGDVYLRKLDKQPSLEMSHNFGIGGLRNGDLHAFGHKTMERGFFESGLFMNNLAVIGGFGLDIGIGAGVFARYGPYSFPEFGDNFVYKLAIEITP